MIIPCRICKQQFDIPYRPYFMKLVPDVCSLSCFKAFVDKAKPSHEVVLDFPKVRVFDDVHPEMRSTYETRFAGILSGCEIKFLYEPFMFQLFDGRKRYVPDFYIPKKMLFEVKGLWQNGAKQKVRQFSVDFPDYPLYLIDLPFLKMCSKR